MTMQRITVFGASTVFAIVDIETDTEILRFDNYDDAVEFMHFLNEV